MKYVDGRLVDWNMGNEVIWYNWWNKTDFGLYVAEVIQDKHNNGQSESHVFVRVKKIIYESKGTYHYKIGEQSPGNWPESMYATFDDLGKYRGRRIIQDIFTAQ